MVKETRRRRWSPEMITANPAVIIGLSALLVPLYETHLVREHQKASGSRWWASPWERDGLPELRGGTEGRSVRPQCPELVDAVSGAPSRMAM